MVAGLGRELLGDGLAGLTRSAPTAPLFYIFFAAHYLTLPVADYLIFRRLWGLPPAGLAATIKKRVANDVIFSYSGEAYLYAWARAPERGVADPLAAVKDVSILSAMAGNAATLAAMAVALPLGRGLVPPGYWVPIAWSGAAVVAMSLPFLLFRRRVFSLPRGELRWVFRVHLARQVAASALLGLAWASAMPEAGLATWLLLAAGRLVVSRLPLLPNKDLLFANLAVAVIGRGEALSELVAFTGALFLLAHAVLIAGFGIGGLIARRGRQAGTAVTK